MSRRERTPGEDPEARRGCLSLTGEAFRSRLAQSDADDSGKDVSFVIDVDGAAVGSVSLFDVDGLARHAFVMTSNGGSD